MANFLTVEQYEAHVAALQKELEGYEARGNDERAALVKEQIKALGDSPSADEEKTDKPKGSRSRK